MSYIFTGRSRTLTVSGTIIGRQRAKKIAAPGFWLCQSNQAYERPALSITAPWGANVTAGPCGGIASFGVETTASNGFGASDSDNDCRFETQWMTPDVPGGWDDHDMTGSFTMSVPVKEAVEFSGTAWTGYDAPAITSMNLVEIAEAGATATATITCGGVTSTASGSVSADTVISGYLASVDLQVSALGGLDNPDVVDMAASGTATVGLDWLSASLPYTLSRSRDSGQATIDAGGTAYTVKAASACGTEARLSSVSLSVAPDKPFSLAGVARSPFGAYPSNLKLKVTRAASNYGTVTASGGAFSDSYNQKKYSVSGGFVLSGVTYTEAGTAVDEWANLETSVILGTAGDGLTDTLYANGDDRRDTRVTFRAFAPFAVGSIWQGTVTQVDPGTVISYSGTPYTGAWEAVENGTVMLISGTVALVGTAAAGNTASFRRTFTATGGAAFDGYRYLRMTMVAQGSAAQGTVSVALGGKSWSKDRYGAAIAPDTAPSAFVIDLCSPNNQTAATDTTDTRWPLPTTDGPYWGVTAASSVEMTGVRCPGTVFIKPVELIGTAFTELTALGDFDNWVLEQSGTVGDVVTDTYDRRFLLGVTDGRQGLEQRDAAKIVTTSSGGSGTAYVQYDLKTLINSLNNSQNPNLEPTELFAGWAGTVTAGTTDGTVLSTWLNANRPATWLYGSHAWWNPSGTAWNYAGTLNVRSGTVGGTAQAVCDSIGWYPGCGDALQVSASTAYGGTLLVRAAYVARGAAHGLILATDGTAYNGSTVTANDTTDGVSAGSDISDSVGWFQTGANFAHGQHSITVQPGTAGGYTWPSSAFTAINRHLTRRVFKPQQEGDHWISYDVSDAGRHVRAYESGGAVMFGASTNRDATAWDDRSIGVNGFRPDVKFYKPDSDQRAYVAYEESSGGPVKLLYSTSEGRTVTNVATLFTSGKYPRTHVTKDGRILVFCVDSGAIKGVILDGQNNVEVSQFTAIASGVDDDAIDVSSYPYAGGKSRVKLTYRSGGTIIDANSPDGVVFT